MSAICAITDGSERIDLLSPEGNGYRVRQWIPALAEPSGGGVWQQSPLANGRRLVMRPMDNITDGVVLALSEDDINEAIREMRRLRGLLEEAVAYWENDNATKCVWWEVRGSNESNIRYALIYDYRTPKDPDPFNPPFFAPGRSIIDEFPLILEHGFWQPVPPDQDTCLEISSMQAHVSKITATRTVQETAASDDAQYRPSDNLFVVGGGFAIIGKGATMPDTHPHSVCLRFNNIVIPPGATILTAHIELMANNDWSGDNTNVVISGEKRPNPITFSTYANMKARPRTRISIPWTKIAFWFLGNWYNSSDISYVVQELIDQSEWMSGNSMVLFIDDNQRNPSTIGAHRDFTTFPTTPPKLVITYATGLDILGRDVTCLPEVYVVNKHVRAQLTHIVAYDHVLAAYSGNLYTGNVFPLALTQDPAHVSNNFIYFGCSTATSELGPFGGYAPFDSLVIDNQTGWQAGIWEYYDGGTGWQPLTVNDNSTFVDTVSAAWEIAGVHSIHWIPPSGWATCDPGMGTTGWWIRFAFLAGAVAPGPWQYNRHIYTLNRPCIDILAEDVGGDIPLLLRLQIINVSNYKNSLYLPALWANRVMVASRSLSRGEFYSPFINIADKQNDPNIAIAVADIGEFMYYPFAPAGRVVRYIPGALRASAIQATITISDALALEYYGKYRVFVRAKQVGGNDGDVGVKVTISFGGINIFTSDEVFTKRTGYSELLELGQATIINIIGENYADTITANVYCSAGVASTFYLYELILFPVDEYVGDYIDRNVSPTPGYLGGRSDHRSMLEVNSTTEHKKQVSANVKAFSSVLLAPMDGILYSRYTPVQVGQAFVQSNSDQRLWFLAERIRAATSEWVSDPDTAFIVKVFAVPRYHSMRGST